MPDFVNTQGILYLIPATLGAESLEKEIPAGNIAICNELKEFIVENVRTARRFLRYSGYVHDFSEVKFHVLDKHTRPEDVPEFLNNLKTGESIGLLSEAGCPCIADPGQKVVKMAHEQGIKVVPLVGPSSILMALISSGFNGQSFTFHGYLPIDKKERISKIRFMENEAFKNHQTQIFMETPFRNNALIQDILSTCGSTTLLCIASNISTADEFIATRTIHQWKKETPDLHKKPSVFLLYK